MFLVGQNCGLRRRESAAGALIRMALKKGWPESAFEGVNGVCRVSESGGCAERFNKTSHPFSALFRSALF